MTKTDYWYYPVYRPVGEVSYDTMTLDENRNLKLYETEYDAFDTILSVEFGNGKNDNLGWQYQIRRTPRAKSMHIETITDIYFGSW